ncbi:hypothetical protein L4C42_16260 [Vibrio wakamikoensis]|uniref:transposase n=1 Tax=Vibrio wakamikoensis TaxID=2910251 RepID=UPI003D190510
MSNKKVTQFDKTFKHSIASEVLSGRLTGGMVASNIGVATSTVRRWCREYQKADCFEVSASFAQREKVQVVERAIVLIEQQSDLLLLSKELLNSNPHTTGRDKLDSRAALQRRIKEGVEPASDILQELRLLLNPKHLDTAENIA